MDDGHDAGHEFCAGFGLEVFEEGPEGRAAKFSQEPAVALEEDAEHLRVGKDYLVVGDIKEMLFSHPLTPLLKPLGMT